MRILLNAVSAKMGGAVNYIKNLAVELARAKDEHEFLLIAPEEQAKDIRMLAPNIGVLSTNVGYEGVGARLWFDHVTLRRLIRREKIDVLFSTANFAMIGCPCRQVLLIRNTLHFSRVYEREILARKGTLRRLEHFLRRQLVCQSARTADIVMTPSESMLDDLRHWCLVPREKSLVNYYGVNTALLQVTRQPSDSSIGNRRFRLVYTSLYAEHKNLNTLLRALLELVRSGTDFHLITTANPNWHQAYWTSTWKKDAKLAALPELVPHVEFKTECTIEEIAELYAGADIFVYPSAIESFGHPLVEAMTVGLPIVAADSPVNRELCRDAAVYFSPFDPRDFARQIRRVVEDHQLRMHLVHNGLERSRDFRWRKHVEILLESFRRLSTSKPVLQGP